MALTLSNKNVVRAKSGNSDLPNERRGTFNTDLVDDEHLAYNHKSKQTMQDGHTDDDLCTEDAYRPSH